MKFVYVNIETYKDAKIKLEKLKTSSHVHSCIESEDDDAEVQAKFVREIRQKKLREEFEKQRKSFLDASADLKRKVESKSSKSTKKSKLSKKDDDIEESSAFNANHSDNNNDPELQNINSMPIITIEQVDKTMYPDLTVLQEDLVEKDIDDRTKSRTSLALNKKSNDKYEDFVPKTGNFYKK